MRAATGGLAAALTIAALLHPRAADASTVEYDLVPDASRISFVYTENGNEQSGDFERFTSRGRFDPDAPETAELEFSVSSASISLGNPLVDAFATSAEWFDSQNHPEVRFRLDMLSPMGPGRYLARGTLEIRGKSQAVAAPVALGLRDGALHASGELTVDRRPYSLGTGPSAAFVDIGPLVTVRFDLTARPAR